jgi:hypothetical protein
MVKQTIKLIIKGRIVIILIIIFASSLLSADLFVPIIILTALYLLLMTAKVKTSFLRNIWPLLLILFIGTVGILNHQSKHILRDISYALIPIALLYLGYWLSEGEITLTQILKVLLIGGTIISIIHISKFIIDPELISTGIYNIRIKAENPNIGLVVFSLVIGTFQTFLFKENLFPKTLPRFIALPLILLSFILSFSRTGLIMGVIITSSVLGLIGRINFKTILFVVILISSLLLLVLTTPPDEVNTFRGKIARSTKEITISDYKNMTDINSNWRGFETFKALVTFLSGNTKQKIIGQGFGAQVDLGFTMTLSGVNFSEIPILHNGYAYVLVKTGIAGILCYLFFYFNLLRISIKSSISVNHEQTVLSKLLFGVLLSIMLSMFVVGGMAEIHDSEYVLLVGFILRRIELLEIKNLSN